MRDDTRRPTVRLMAFMSQAYEQNLCVCASVCDERVHMCDVERRDERERRKAGQKCVACSVADRSFGAAYTREGSPRRRRRGEKGERKRNALFLLPDLASSFSILTLLSSTHSSDPPHIPHPLPLSLSPLVYLKGENFFEQRILIRSPDRGLPARQFVARGGDEGQPDVAVRQSG